MSALTTFLHRDIHPQDGHRLLLPFLTTMDRLRLSECSQALLEYRYHLSKVKIVSHPSPTPGNRRGLVRLLLDQHQHGGLEYLCVDEKSMLHLLDLASWGCFEGLKTLDLTKVALSDDAVYGLNEEDMSYLTRALQGGGLRSLEGFELDYWPPEEEEGADSVVNLLGTGVCPHLRRLGYRRSEPEDDFGQALAEALESGHLHELQELDLWHNSLGGAGGGAAIARALGGGACTMLTKLDLCYCGLTSEDGQASGEAIRSGSCAQLEVLGLVGNQEFGGDGVVAMLGALGAGSCPSLKRLHLGDVARFSLQSAAALAHVLQSGCRPSLEHLDLAIDFDDDYASLLVFRAIKMGGRGPMSNLRYLRFIASPTGQEHGRVLGEAIAEGALPSLESLWMPSTRLSDGGMVPIMEGLEMGGCHHLKQLAIGSVGMGPQRGQALARALSSGNLSHLNMLYAFNNDVGDAAMAEVVKGLRKCPQSRELCVGETGMSGMTGQALVEALQAKSWPLLETLLTEGNEGLLGEDGVVWGLIGVLERRADLCPRLKEVSLLEETGLDEMGEAGSRLAGLLVGMGADEA